MSTHALHEGRYLGCPFSGQDSMCATARTPSQALPCSTLPPCTQHPRPGPGRKLTSLIERLCGGTPGSFPRSLLLSVLPGACVPVGGPCQPPWRNSSFIHADNVNGTVSGAESLNPLEEPLLRHSPGGGGWGVHGGWPGPQTHPGGQLGLGVHRWACLGSSCLSRSSP